MKPIDCKSQSPCLTSKMAKGTEWSVLSPEEFKIFNENIVCKSYDLGKTIFYEGDACKGLYVVESGLIGVRRTDAEGERILIRLANPGDTLGYRPLLAEESHRGSAEVMQAAKVCFLPKIIVRRFLIGNPGLGAQFLLRTARELGVADERFFETVTLPARVRLINLLMGLREHCGHIVENGSLLLDLPLTRRDIASMLGIRAESLSRVVREIESEGLANFSGNHVTIVNPDTLLKTLNGDNRSL